MRPQVKVSNSNDRYANIKAGVYWGISTPIPAISSHFLMMTGELGTMYGCTIISDYISDYYVRDDGEHYLKLAADLLEEENGRS
jgi:hypothetical protein